MRPWEDFLKIKSVDLFEELGAYEHLWCQPDSTTKKIADLFRNNPGLLPSELVHKDVALETASRVLSELQGKGVRNFGFSLHGASNYPSGLRAAKHPVESFYHVGNLDLLSSQRRVAVVGTRQISAEGAKRTTRLVKELVRRDVVIFSGLAAGVDAVAHKTAIEAGGGTVAVIGTPISEFYPKENRDLQSQIASEFLLVSQVPVLHYAQRDYRWNRVFFPERNKTMSALTDATIIVEASETSGTLIQARAAIEQGRKLFILESNFQNSAITWPAKFEAEGAIRVKTFEDIERNLF